MERTHIWEHAEVLQEAKRLEAKAVHLSFRHNKTSVVHWRRFQSQLPVSMEPTQLLETLRDLPTPAIQGADAGAPGVGPVTPQLTQNVPPKCYPVAVTGSSAVGGPISAPAFSDIRWSLLKPDR